MNEEIIIGIDPSMNSSGIVILDKQGNPLNYESINPLPLDRGERLVHNFDRYCTLFRAYRNIKCIAFEKQVPQMRFQRDAGNILDLAENIATLKMAISVVASQTSPGVLVLGFTPNQIKKFATSNYKATKEEMMAQVPARHMNAIKKHIPDYAINDIADGYFAARYAHKLLSMGEDVSEYIYKQY